MQIFDVATIVGAAAASTIAAIYWILKSQNRAAEATAEVGAPGGKAISFLFEKEELNHASDNATRLFQLRPGQEDWTGLRERLLNRFPDLPEIPTDALPGETEIAARDVKDAATLVLSREGDFTALTLNEDKARISLDAKRVGLLQREVEDLRRASDTTPHAIWQVDSKGIVTWYNAAYKTLYQRLHKTDPNEKRPVFQGIEGLDDRAARQRVAVPSRDGAIEDWYDVNAASVGDITIHHAVNVNAIVKSEVAQRNFVQTLAKTFAQLSIGLAIFDRNGQLALFNPALIDLTNLPADFLSGRPTLMSFFDRIRENRRMPEPKNYTSWRQQIADVIAAATDGRYQETWTLETGQTYRVSGRPHPDGAIAFLIEDISAEVSLTRNFRAELELGQSLMDSFEEALVVFSSTGVLTFCNMAYRRMWGTDPDNSFADFTIHDCIEQWRSLCEGDVNWRTLSDFVMDFGEKTTWDMPVKLAGGPRVKCQVSRIATGATILRFVDADPVAQTGKKPRKTAAST